MSPSGVLLIIAAALAGLGIIFWLVGFAVGRGRRRGWSKTTGRWVRFESGLTRAWRVEYAVDGETYRIMPLMNMLTFSPNGTVDVAYDPREPRRAVIDEFSHRGGTMKLIGLIAGVVAAVCAAVSVVMRMAGA